MSCLGAGGILEVPEEDKVGFHEHFGVELDSFVESSVLGTGHHHNVLESGMESHEGYIAALGVTEVAVGLVLLEENRLVVVLDLVTLHCL